MIGVSAIAHSFAMFGGVVAAVLVSVAAVILHRRQRSWATLTFLVGLAIVWMGSAVQLAAPMGDYSYVRQNGEIVGATGTLSTTWYVGSIVFYSGLLLAAVGFLMYAFSRRSGQANDA